MKKKINVALIVCFLLSMLNIPHVVANVENESKEVTVLIELRWYLI